MQLFPALFSAFTANLIGPGCNPVNPAVAQFVTAVLGLPVLRVASVHAVHAPLVAGRYAYCTDTRLNFVPGDATPLIAGALESLTETGALVIATVGKVVTFLTKTFKV